MNREPPCNPLRALATLLLLGPFGSGCFATHDGGGGAGTSGSATNVQPGAKGSGKAGTAGASVSGSGVNGKGVSGSTSAGGTGTSPNGKGTPTAGVAGAGDSSAAPASVQRLCSRGGSCREVVDVDVDKVDLLFMVDNSDSMANKQLKLRAQFPRLISALTTGDGDGDGIVDFPPARDLHLGVVTSDMGLPNVEGIQNCQGLGQDGILQGIPSAQGMGCQASYPPFLSFKSGVNQPVQTAADFACATVVGTGGCGFEHQLEAPLKALWPATDPMPVPVNGMNRIQFLIDPLTGKGATGHGDVENQGFLRNDPIAGLSLIGIIVLTDEDDCSASDTRPFTPPQYLDPSDPLIMEGMNLRCHYNQQALYPVERYINGFKALRPGNENMVLFAAIAGVPIDLVDPSTQTDFSVSEQRDKFYQNILDDVRMKETVDTQGTPDPSDDRLVHSCREADPFDDNLLGQRGAADPPIRIVKVAQGFGENGIVQSSCQPDYVPVFDAIIARLRTRLGATCLAQGIARNSQGLVACDLLWELPPPGQAPTSTPVACGAPGYGFLLPPDKTHPAKSDAGGAVCRVAQLAVVNQAGGLGTVSTQVNGTNFTEGWYYDDFSDDATRNCREQLKQRISFTIAAKPPTGVTMVLDCAQ